MMMKISVIIVSWNVKAFLLECIRSILLQRLTVPVEIIVVDNGSSDGSPEAVKKSFPNVQLICNKENYGFAKANNIGIKTSQGDYLFLINSDVIVHEGCFDKMISYMTTHPEIGILSPKIVDSKGQVQRSCMGYPSLWNTFSRAMALDSLFPKSKLFGSQLLTYWGHNEIRSVEVINGCFWMLRRSAIEHVGLLDENFFIYGEDIDWCRRFYERGWKLVFFPDAKVTHYGGASSANAPARFYLEQQRAKYQYWTKHHSRLASTVFLLINLLHHAARFAGEIAVYPLMRAKRIDTTYKITRSIASMRWTISTITNGK